MKKALAISSILALLAATAVLGLDNSPKNVTIENLKAAYAGETTASAKYAAYAKKASEEGYSKVAKLFEAASRSEGFHAANHRAVLEQLGVTAPEVIPDYKVASTVENLQDAIKGESYEVAKMYPEFLKNAAEAKISIASISLNYAYETEKTHKKLYTKALEAVQGGAEDALSGQYAVCSTCGNTYDASVPNRCGICMTSKDRFVFIA